MQWSAGLEPKLLPFRQCLFIRGTCSTFGNMLALGAGRDERACAAAGDVSQVE